MKKTEVLKDIVENISKDKDLFFSGIFGSRFFGTPHRNSDIDIFFFFKSKLSKNKLEDIFSKYGRYLAKVSFNGYTKKPLYKNSGFVHLCVFDNELSFKNFLNFDFCPFMCF